MLCPGWDWLLSSSPQHLLSSLAGLLREGLELLVRPLSTVRTVPVRVM